MFSGVYANMSFYELYEVVNDPHCIHHDNFCVAQIFEMHFQRSLGCRSEDQMPYPLLYYESKNLSIIVYGLKTVNKIDTKPLVTIA